MIHFLATMKVYKMYKEKPRKIVSIPSIQYVVRSILSPGM
jgi:hypothetical protein